MERSLVRLAPGHGPKRPDPTSRPVEVVLGYAAVPARDFCLAIETSEFNVFLVSRFPAIYDSILEFPRGWIVFGGGE